jgi:hypothetical protein
MSCRHDDENPFNKAGGTLVLISREDVTILRRLVKHRDVCADCVTTVIARMLASTGGSS